MRHEVPLEIGDPFLFVERGGQAFVLTNQLERARIAEVVRDAVRAARAALGEDLLLITEDGCETLTSYPYDL
jgi:hypothetical protein